MAYDDFGFDDSGYDDFGYDYSDSFVDDSSYYYGDEFGGDEAFFGDIFTDTPDSGSDLTDGLSDADYESMAQSEYFDTYDPIFLGNSDDVPVPDGQLSDDDLFSFIEETLFGDEGTGSSGGRGTAPSVSGGGIPFGGSSSGKGGSPSSGGNDAIAKINQTLNSLGSTVGSILHALSPGGNAAATTAAAGHQVGATTKSPSVPVSTTQLGIYGAVAVVLVVLLLKK